MCSHTNPSGTNHLAKVTTDGYYSYMKVVGVKVLKAKLSEYLRLVKTGETILVTERDEVVAEIRPANRRKIGEMTLQEKLAAMAERGEATLRSVPRRKDWKRFLEEVPKREAVSSQKILDDLREDSR